MRCYVGSVGCGANLLLNIAPGRDGLVPDADWVPARDFGSATKRLFSKPVVETSGKGMSIELNLDGATDINCIDIQEDIRKGQRVTSFSIRGKTVDGQWALLVSGKSIGHRKINLIKPARIQAVKVEFSDPYAEPIIKSLKLFNSPEFDEFREYMEEETI